jgi:DedD protein
VQLGVFVNPASARRLERQLRDKKFAVVVDEITRSGKTMFRVRVGPEVDRAAANALAKKLADAGHKGSVVK